MADNSEKFNNIASGIQSIMLSVAVIIGGWWTLKTFVFQNPTFVEERWMMTGVDKEELLNGSIVISALNKKKRIYAAKLEITNSNPVALQFIPLDTCPLYYSRVERKGTDFKIIRKYKTYAITASTVGDVDDQGVDEKGKLSRLSIPKTQTRRVSFIFAAPEKGSYLLEINPCERYRKSCFIQEYTYVE